jgi:hypothetical protein
MNQSYTGRNLSTILGQSKYIFFINKRVITGTIYFNNLTSLTVLDVLLNDLIVRLSIGQIK